MKKTIFGVTIAGASALLLGFIFKAYDFSTYTLATTTFLGFIYGIYNKLQNTELEQAQKLLSEDLIYSQQMYRKEKQINDLLKAEVDLLVSEVRAEATQVEEVGETITNKPVRRKRTTKNTK